MFYFILLSFGGGLFLDGEKRDKPYLHMWFQEPRSDEMILFNNKLISY